MHLFSIADMLCPSKSRSLRAAACNRISLSFWSSSLRCFKVATSFGSMMWQGCEAKWTFFWLKLLIWVYLKKNRFLILTTSIWRRDLYQHIIICYFWQSWGYSCEHTENRSTASNDKAKALSDIKPAKNSDSEILLNHSDPLKNH